MTNVDQDKVEAAVGAPPCDFLLVIALEEEFTHLLSVLKIRYEPVNVDGIHCYHFRLPSPRSSYAEGIATFIGEMGINEANLITYRLMSELSPGLVVNIGISGVVDPDVKLGDVVVATESDNYLHRSKIKQRDPTAPLSLDDLIFGGKSLPATDTYYRLIKNLPFTHLNMWNGWLSAAHSELVNELEDATIAKLESDHLISRETKVHVGSIACGPWVGAAQAFKKILDKRNRNYLAMDMESYGVLQAAQQRNQPQTLILRGISDPADERKELLDSVKAGFLRRWSMSNALRLFARVIEKVELTSYSQRDPVSLAVTPETKEDLANKVHEAVVREYLTPPYNNPSYVRTRSFEEYSDLFSTFTDFEFLEDNKRLFETLSEVTRSSDSNTPLLIEGPAGAGKTSLLSLLYWYSLDSVSNGEVLPVFVNLHRYNEFSPQHSSNSSETEQVLRSAEQHVESLEKYISRYPDHPVLVIVDGYDEFARFKEPVLEYLSVLLKNARHWKIIGSREGTKAFRPDAPENLPTFSASLRPVGTNEHVYHDFVEAFVAIAWPEGGHTIGESMRDLISNCRLRYVDFFILSLAIDQCKGARPPVPHSLSALLENYCQRYLRARLNKPTDQPTLLERAAEIAFSFELQKKISFKADERTLWELGQQHPRVSDYLTARHMVTEFLKASDEKPHLLPKLPPNVYPHRINHLAKELLNRDEATQHRFILALDRILKHKAVHAYAKAQACYLAGRLEGHQVKQSARKILNDLRSAIRKQQLSGENVFSREELLLVRTMYISLAYLGEENAQEEYINGLISDREMDMFNRGFHLEYYEDQKYTPLEALISSDQLEPCPRTFDQLISNLSDDKENPISEIELFTLCSLAQHRHAVARLGNEDRIRIMDLLGELLQRRVIKSNVLRNYVRMIMKHIKHENFHISRIFHDYYEIKNTKRSGWLSRGIRDGESVADHSYGAYLLALFLLPDEWSRDASYSELPKDTYSKPTIMNMLLIHDLAEAITGDILPTDSNEASRHREREVYEELALLGTYQGLAKMREIGELWEEFEGQQTLNARVAKDIDKLENLVQLWVYAREGKEIRDFDDWWQELLDSIKTAPGELALRKLLAAYESKS